MILYTLQNGPSKGTALLIVSSEILYAMTKTEVALGNTEEDIVTLYIFFKFGQEFKFEMSREDSENLLQEIIDASVCC